MEDSIFKWFEEVMGHPDPETLFERALQRYIATFPRRIREAVAEWCGVHREVMQAMWQLSGDDALSACTDDARRYAKAIRSRRASRKNWDTIRREHSRRPPR